MTILLTGSFLVYEDEIYQSSDGSIVFDYGWDGAWSSWVFDNFGTIRATGPTGAIAFSAANGGGLLNNRGAVIVETTGGPGTGFRVSSWGPEVHNYGLWSVTASGDAMGLVSWSPGQVFANSGRWLVASTGGAATGVQVANGMVFSNTGVIQVTAATRAIGIYMDRSEGSAFVNNGEISASGATSFGLVLSGLSYNVDSPNIINNGTISAGVAIASTTGGYSPAQHTIQHVLNNGLLAGSIDLGLGADIIDNRNEIRGSIFMGDGADTVDTRYGVITGAVDLQEGNDLFLGGARGQVVFGYLGDDTMYGGAGNDSFSGENGSDVLFGGAGDDLLEGGSAPDTLIGGAGADVLDGGTGSDWMDGGDGDDIFVAGAGGTNTLVGGAGTDLLSFSHFLTGVYLNLSAGAYSGDSNWDGFVGIEGVIGSAGNDTFIGDSGANVLFGLAGADVLIGGFGIDRLSGGVGNDWLDGGDGDDVLEGGAGINVLLGGNGLDIASFETASLGVWVDLRAGAYSSATTWDAFSSIEGLSGSVHADTLFGDASDNRLLGNHGSDTLLGLEGNDSLDGGDGSDWLVGGDGNDVLIGGAGVDVYTGGAGADIFDLGVAAGWDVAFDFDTTADRFDLGGLSWLGFLTIDADGDGALDDTLLGYDGGNFVALNVSGLTLGQWNALVAG